MCNRSNQHHTFYCLEFSLVCNDKYIFLIIVHALQVQMQYTYFVGKYKIKSYKLKHKVGRLKPPLVLTVLVNTIILSEKWSILFFFISKMMKIFIWGPNLKFYYCINLLNILKHHWITFEIYLSLRHIFRFSGAVLNTFMYRRKSKQLSIP